MHHEERPHEGLGTNSSNPRTVRACHRRGERVARRSETKASEWTMKLSPRHEPSCILLAGDVRELRAFALRCWLADLSGFTGFFFVVLTASRLFFRSSIRLSTRGGASDGRRVRSPRRQSWHRAPPLELRDSGAAGSGASDCDAHRQVQTLLPMFPVAPSRCDIRLNRGSSALPTQFQAQCATAIRRISPLPFTGFSSSVDLHLHELRAT